MTAGAARTRADAVRNYERVLNAAAEVLAEKGADAAVPEIAARAGVGKGTVYRCFPTKEHLVGAVLAERVRSYTRSIESAAEHPDAWTAFERLLAGWAERQATDCTFAEGLGHDYPLPEMREAKTEMYAALERLIARAKAEGRMRDDASADDVRVMFGGMARMLRADGNHDPAAWRRQAALVAAALRA
jgi:AcrR family transcriptional regulator